jgi:hypothetical protein
MVCSNHQAQGDGLSSCLSSALTARCAPEQVLIDPLLHRALLT